MTNLTDSIIKGESPNFKTDYDSEDNDVDSEFAETKYVENESPIKKKWV